MTTTKNQIPKLLVLLAAMALALPFSAWAQDAPKEEGVNQGNYNIRQSFEFGGRITDFTGNKAVYRTFDNLTSGPRLLEHRLEMRSLNHQGWLFDDFFLHSFGYGGDPNAVTRLRAYKNRWYNFSGTFRMDRHEWDYNLLANPLNPTTSNPFVATTFSLHKFDTVRRMSDFNLTMMPQSPVRFRVGYTRNISEGPSFSTFHEGTDILTFQNWKTTLNSYSFGVDFRMLPKTNISFDQFFHQYKGDTTWIDQPGVAPLGVPRFLAQLANGTPVDLGIIFNSVANQPCGAPISNNTTTPPTANATCNAYLYYDRAGNVRTNYPTSQISLQTSALENFDFSGRFAYSSSDADVLGYQEGANARVSRTNQRIFALSGPSEAKRVSATADAGLTWHVFDKLRIVDSFHFTHFRIPGLFDLAECSLFGTSLATAPTQWTGQATLPAGCARILAVSGQTAVAGTPTHSARSAPTATSLGSNSSSPADIINETFSQFLGQETKQNQLEALIDFSPKISSRFGYRYTKREITQGRGEGSTLVFFPNLAIRGACALAVSAGPDRIIGTADDVRPGTFNPVCTTTNPANPDVGVNTFNGPLTFENPEATEINEHVFLLGVSFRPSNLVRLGYDMEIGTADETFTRISPRNFQLYRFRSTFRPKDWIHAGFSFNIIEKQNDVTEIFHKQHARTYSFNLGLEPNERFLFDFGYDFNDIFSQTNICFVGSLQPPGTSPCPSAAALLQQISLYDQDTQYGYFNLMWKPVRRVQTRLGYAIVSTTGSTLILTPNAPSGPLQFNYHKPYAAVDLDLTRGFVFRTNWGYYGYNEKAVPDPTTSARDFRGNVVTLSIRYGF